MIGAFICFAIAMTGIWVIIQTAFPHKPRRRSSYYSSAIQDSHGESWHKGKGAILSTGSEKPSRAELRLSAYLFFDAKQTARLVEGIQARFPDKTRKWCAEKALSDLERDRQMR